MSFKLTILGSNSATPAYGRHPSAQILKHLDTQFLIDCGEGTQFQMNKYHIKRKNLDYIFISHLHGDHYFGLVGLLNTLRLNGRKKPLHLFGFPKLWEIICTMIEFDKIKESYPLIFHPLHYGESEKILTTNHLEVFTLPLKHGIDCNGFLFKEKEKPRHIIAEKIKEYNIPYQEINAIKKGKDYVDKNGNIIGNHLLTTPPTAQSSYAYCSDTIFDEDLIPYIKDVTCLYHETTFLAADSKKAKLRNHSTTHDAAFIAQKSNAKKLLIGHFSARYKDLDIFHQEARSIFKNTSLAIEGVVFEF